MLEFVHAEPDSDSIMKYADWVSKQWADPKLFQDIIKMDSSPKPLLAFMDDRLIGGLSFIFFNEPDNSKSVIWINTVYIIPEMRKQGFAGLLIKKAEITIAPGTQEYLYVYTDKPELYLKLDWQIQKKDKLNFILKKRLQVI